jgi:DNA-binding HxlR family transcriptional regulator
MAVVLVGGGCYTTLLAIRKLRLPFWKRCGYTLGMSKSYAQYCPIAHALDLVGERWSLLIVRELLHDGALRYSDLHARLEGCGTNILASRLKALEKGGVVRRRRLDPPAASWVYELTEYGEGLRSVLHVLAHWGARSLRPPARAGDLEEGWLHGALCIALPSTDARLEFHIGDEVASVDGGEVVDGPLENPDAVISGDPAAFYGLLVDRDLEAISIEGDAEVVRALLAALPPVPVLDAAPLPTA